MSDGDSSTLTFAKMSEHATGNAVDNLALGLADKRQIGISAVANELNPDHRLLMALRLTACGYFTTVLPPMPTNTIWILAFMARAETIAFASRFLLRSDTVSSGRADDCHGNAPAWV